MPIVLRLIVVALAAPIIFWIFLITTGLGGHYKIPAASMAPTLNVGDHFYVSKLNYAFSDTMIPSRGDVIVFKNPQTRITMVKRVVGLPNDTLKVSSGRLIINGKTARREYLESFLYRDSFDQAVDLYHEYLFESDQQHSIFEQTDQGPLDNTEEFKVPAGHVFVMGDNRDNSTDSRAVMGPGFVHVEYVIGKAKYILFQSKTCKVEENMKCPPKSFMKKL